MNRKTFLRSLGVGAVGVLSSSAIRGATPTGVVTLPTFNARDPEPYWRGVRSLYPLADDPLYLNTGGLGPTSSRVLERVAATTLKLQQHSETGFDLLEPARVKVAAYLGAKAEDLCFTRNATEATSIIAAGLSLREGDEVIFESHAHPGGSFPWFNQAKLRGVKVRLFETDSTSPEANLDRIKDLVTPRTRVIQVSHITCTLGVVLPVRELAAFARERGIWFHIDGAQSVGMIPVKLGEIGCDSYAVSGHKWLGAPHETGLLYLRHARLEDVAVTEIGAHSGELNHLPGEIAYRDTAARHEYGTRNAAVVTGIVAAVELQEEIGRERIAAWGLELATTVSASCQGLKSIRLLTPAKDAMRASIVTVQHDRADASKLFGYLLTKHRLRCRPVTEQGLQAVRISMHVFNSAADASRVVTALRAANQEL